MHSKPFFHQISINSQVTAFEKDAPVFHQIPDDRGALTAVHR
jgi:hypothetical protein